MKARKNSSADSLKDTIAAFGAMVQREAEALATTAIESFKRNYRRRVAKGKPAARSSVKRTTAVARKIAAATTKKAKAVVKRSRKPRNAARTATRTRKLVGKSRRRKSA